MQTENNTQESTTACGENHINPEIKSDDESIWLFIFVILSIIVIRFVPCDPNAPHDLQCYKSYNYSDTNNFTLYCPQVFTDPDNFNEHKEYNPIENLHKEMDEHDRWENEYIEGYRMYKKELHEPEPLHLHPLHEHE